MACVLELCREVARAGGRVVVFVGAFGPPVRAEGPAVSAVVIWEDLGGGVFVEGPLDGWAVQGYLAHKKLLPHRTLQYAYA